jgi:hypothetical protein
MQASLYLKSAIPYFTNEARDVHFDNGLPPASAW